MFLMITSSHQFCCFRGRQTFLQAVSFSLLVLLALSINSSHALAQADYDTRLEKGVELFSQLKYPEAGVFFQNLIKSEPERKEAHFWLGKTYAKEGRWNEARDVFKQYVKLGPQDVDGQREIARSYEVEGNVELARLWHMKVLEINPTHKATLDDLAKLEQPTPKENKPPEVPAKKVEIKDAANERKGFWQQGVAGLLGARSVWWGRLIAVVIFLSAIPNSSIQVKEMRRRLPQVSPGPLVFFAIPGAIFSYIVFWGIPQNLGAWGLVAAYTVAQTVVVRQAVE